MTTDDVREILRSLTKESQAGWAKAHGMSPGYVSDVLNGRREPGEPILKALGLRCERSYHWQAREAAQ